jgi:SOS-response transcriptional repressor LexA
MNSNKNKDKKMNSKYKHDAFNRTLQLLREQEIDIVTFRSRIGASSQTWVNWGNDGLPYSKHFVVADSLGVNVEWLVKGTGDKFKSTEENDNERKSKVPMIGFSQVKSWTESKPVEIKEYMPECPVKHTDRTFALRVVNDSMTSTFPGMRSYPIGSVIYVDPGVEVKSGCRVIVGAKESSDSRFREYLEDGEQRYLKPLNQQYPTQEMTEDSIIYGVVIGMYTPE